MNSHGWLRRVLVFVILGHLNIDVPSVCCLNLGDAAALVVGDLAFIWLVGPVVIHVAWPEATVDFVACYDLLRLCRQDQQVLEADRRQRSR